MLYVTGAFQRTADFPTGGTLTSVNNSSDIYRMALNMTDPAPAASLSAATTSSLENDLALLSLLTDADGSPTGTPKKRL